VRLVVSCVRLLLPLILHRDQISCRCRSTRIPKPGKEPLVVSLRLGPGLSPESGTGERACLRHPGSIVSQEARGQATMMKTDDCEESEPTPLERVDGSSQTPVAQSTLAEATTEGYE